MTQSNITPASTLDGAVLPLVGRLLLSALFVVSGIGKVAAPAATIGYISSVGLPLPTISYLVAVVIEVVGAIAVIVGFKTRLAAPVLAVWTLITALIFHTNFADQMQAINFYKNLGIAGGFVLLGALGAGRWSIDGKLAAR